MVHLYSNFNRTFSKQTLETLIRRHVLWRLVWICTICLRLTKMMLGLYGLNYVCTTMFLHVVMIHHSKYRYNLTFTGNVERLWTTYLNNKTMKYSRTELLQKTTFSSQVLCCKHYSPCIYMNA